MSLAKFRARNHPQQTAKHGASDQVDDRGTTPEVFDPLNARFNFTLDVAAAAHNAKCADYYTIEDDGLNKPWVGCVWYNPPYSDIRPWIEKAWDEWDAGRARVIVMLLPANRTEQLWWQEQVEPWRDRDWSLFHVEFLKGRLRFIKPGKSEVGPNERPPFGCCLLIWGPR